jgi:endonuclease YncB( thermonuclease family)
MRCPDSIIRQIAARRVGLSVFVALLCFAPHAVGAPRTFSGRIAHVVDGDTVDVLTSRARIRVRLAEIDAPEQGQPYGHRSRQSLIQICGGELATIEEHGKDSSGRTVARVVCGRTDANAEQVRRGMAVVFDHYSSPASPLHKIQDEARRARRGLWAQVNPVPPWEWRAHTKAR